MRPLDRNGQAGVAVAHVNSIVLNPLDHSLCVSDSKQKKASSIRASESHKSTLTAADAPIRDTAGSEAKWRVRVITATGFLLE